MIWTLNKATDDILDFIKGIKEKGECEFNFILIPIESVSVISMSESENYYAFTLKIIATHTIVYDSIAKKEFILVKKYTKKKPIMADWNDD